jgi:hypothetical protein
MFELQVNAYSIITLHFLLNNASIVIYSNNAVAHCLVYERALGDVCAVPFLTRLSSNDTRLSFTFPRQWRCTGGPESRGRKVVARVVAQYIDPALGSKTFIAVDSVLSKEECDRKELVPVGRHVYGFFAFLAVHVFAPLLLVYALALAVAYTKRLMCVSVSTS